ncbi:putative ribonuclease H-like domain-containing protein [Tanacetum coccineum]
MLADSKLPTTFWAEAVNTACYMQNRVLVTKPHNKTPYERFLGRKPALSLMRPFRCPVTILNTIDHLGKFDGKADEGFFVESGPNWIFDIDALTKSMNYKPVVAGNQYNGNVGDYEKKVFTTEEQRKAASTNKVNVVGRKASIKLPDEPNMPALEDIVYSDDDDDEDVGAEADMNNLDAFMPFSPVPIQEKDREDLVLYKGQGDIPIISSVVDDIIFGSTKKSLCHEFEKMMHRSFQMSFLQFWATVMAKTVNEKVQLQALVDGKKVIITESTVRRDLHLEDAEGVDCLPNATIFEQLTLIGYEKLSQKLTFYKAFFSPQWKFLIHTILQCLSDLYKCHFRRTTEGSQIINDLCYTISPKKIFGNMRRVGKGFSRSVTPLFPTMMVQAQEEMGEGSANPTDPHHTPTIIQPSTSQPQKKQKPRKPKRKDTKVPQPSGPTTNVADEAVYEEMDDSLERAATTSTSLDVEHDRGNINKTQSKATLNEPSSLGTSSGSGPRRQETMGDTIAQTGFENVSKTSNDSLLAGVNTPRSDEDSLKLKELMELCTNLQNRVIDLKNEDLSSSGDNKFEKEGQELEKENELPDENHVLLKVPRQNNMYSFNLENIVPSGGLACLIAKATTDESNKWHRRLGHVNFKNLNKLVKGNLVRDLPSKLFQNDHTCVACQKGKQHKASYSFLPNTFWAKAVSTACYVLNRVLVTKPHNKTPYELLTGKLPIISYIRPFGCHVTILNTIDHLGKFARKSDEGFLVGYSLQSKAFRVYNLETKRVEENLHITFLENKPNVAGKGPTWLFDLDYLTDSMNYHPVRSKNQANLHAGQQEANQNADDKREGPREEEQVFMDELERLKRQEKEANEEAGALRKKFDTKTENLVIQEGAAKTSSTNIFSTVSTPAKASSTNLVNTVSIPVSTASPHEGLSLSDPTNPEEDDSEIPPLEDIYQHSTDGIFTTSSYDDEGAVADFTNLETVVNVSPITTSRIHSSHPSALILGDPTSAVQTRSKVNTSSGAHAFVSYVHKSNEKLTIWTSIMFILPCFYSHEPKQISESSSAFGRKAIGPKVGLSNKRMKEEFVSEIKQALCSYMGLSLSNGFLEKCLPLWKIDEEVYVSQPPGFLDPKYPKKVYKVVKALYGLHQAPRSCQDKYVAEILKKFDFANVKTASTLIATLREAFVKAEEASDVDVNLYKVTPKSSYLSAVKRIFRKSQQEVVNFLAGDSFLAMQIVDPCGATYIQKQTYCFFTGCKLLWAALISLLTTITLSTTMAVLDSCPKHNMVAYLEKSEGNAGISRDLDFLKRSFSHHALTLAYACLHSLCLSLRRSLRSDLLFDDADGIDHYLIQVYLMAIALGNLLSNRNDQPVALHLLLSSLFFSETSGGNLGEQWMQVFLEANVGKKEISKKQWVHKESFEIIWNLRYAHDVARTREIVDEERAVDENILSTEDVLSTDKEKVSTNKEKVSTDRPIVSTNGSKVSTDRQIEGTAEQIEGTEEQIKSTDGQRKDDETIAKVLASTCVKPKQFLEKRRKPLPKINPKDKGNKKIEEEDESESESDGIPEAEKKFKQLESDEEMARKIQEEWEGEEERNRIAEEKATNEALIRNFDDIKARIEADRLLAEKLQEQEREQFTIEERAKFLHDTIAAQRKFLAQQRSEAIRNRPPTKNQLRNQMMTYLKHVGNFKHSELKTKKFEEIQALYEKIKRSDEDFISIGSAEDERLIKRMNEKGIDSSKSEVIKEESKEEVQEESKEEESTRKRKLGTRKKMKSRKRRFIQNTSEDDSEKENDELRLHLTIAPDEEKEVDYEILDRKYPIKGRQQLVNGQKRYFSTLMRVLSIFDREDLNDVYQLVMDRYQDEIPEGIRISWLEAKWLVQESEEDSTMALELIRFIKKLLAELEPEDFDGDEEDL